MNDPKWNRGFYYDGPPPKTGMKLARQIATITYRSGPEWDQRFGRKLRRQPEELEFLQDPNYPRKPSFDADFLIETYLDHQGSQFEMAYDANSLIYISKAMDLFDMTQPALAEIGLMPASSSILDGHSPISLLPNTTSHLPELVASLARLHKTPALILGVQSDILFPVDQQRELADALRMSGNDQVRYFELGGVWGHDTFLLDTLNVGGAIRGFLS